jgi:hypothetical protein
MVHGFYSIRLPDLLVSLAHASCCMAEGVTWKVPTRERCEMGDV